MISLQPSAAIDILQKSNLTQCSYMNENSSPKPYAQRIQCFLFYGPITMLKCRHNGDFSELTRRINLSLLNLDLASGFHQ